MRKKLIAAIILALIALAAAIGVVFVMESKAPSYNAEQTTGEPAVETTSAPEQETTAAPTEETVGISLPTENPDDVTPEVTIVPDDIVPADTADPNETKDPNATEDPDENATPELEL